MPSLQPRKCNHHDCLSVYGSEPRHILGFVLFIDIYIYIFQYLFRLIFSINLESGFKSCVKCSQLVGSTLALKVHFHAQFSSNPNQTLLNKLINVSRITRRLQAGEFGKGWSFTLQGNES